MKRQAVQARRKQLQIGGTHYRLGGGAHIIFFFFFLFFFWGGGGHICANYWPPHSYGPAVSFLKQIINCLNVCNDSFTYLLHWR